MKIRLARNAIEDLDEIWLYVARDQSIDVAERLLNAISERFLLIAKNPRIGRQRPEIREGLRSYMAGRYRIYYRLEAKGSIRILHVRHSARDERNL